MRIVGQVGADNEDADRATVGVEFGGDVLIGCGD